MIVRYAHTTSDFKREGNLHVMIERVVSHPLTKRDINISITRMYVTHHISWIKLVLICLLIWHKRDVMFFLSDHTWVSVFFCFFFLCLGLGSSSVGDTVSSSVSPSCTVFFFFFFFTLLGVTGSGERGLSSLTPKTITKHFTQLSFFSPILC